MGYILRVTFLVPCNENFSVMCHEKKNTRHFALLRNHIYAGTGKMVTDTVNNLGTAETAETNQNNPVFSVVCMYQDSLTTGTDSFLKFNPDFPSNRDNDDRWRKECNYIYAM